MARKKKEKKEPYVAKRYYFPTNFTQDVEFDSADREFAKKGMKRVKCERCGTSFEVKRRNNKTVLCPDCAAEDKRQKDRERKRRQRERAGMDKNMSYWEQRVHHDLENSRNEIVKKCEQELMFVYDDARDEIEKDILSVLSKIEESKEKGEKIQANDLYRQKRYVELFRHVNEKITDVWSDWGKELEDSIIKSYEEAKKIIDEDGKSVSGTEVDAQLMNVKAVDASQIVNQTWCLDGKKFSSRVWENKDKMMLRMKKALTDCIVRGKSPFATAKEMSEVMNVGINSCYRLLRTETAHAQIMAQTEKYKEFGFTHGKFLADKSCCEECQKHDGKIFTLDELEKRLPVHPNCTCTYSLVRQEKGWEK